MFVCAIYAIFLLIRTCSHKNIIMYAQTYSKPCMHVYNMTKLHILCQLERYMLNLKFAQVVVSIRYIYAYP